MSDYADPDCPTCGGRGFVYPVSLITRPGQRGGAASACARAGQAAAYWEREYPRVRRELLAADLHATPILEVLDAIEYEPGAPPIAALMVGQPGRGKTAPAISTARRLCTSSPYPTGLVIRWPDWIEQLRRAHRRDRDREEDELDRPRSSRGRPRARPGRRRRRC